MSCWRSRVIDCGFRCFDEGARDQRFPHSREIGRMEYINRRDDRYYVFQGKTKTGKPKFYTSKRPESEKGTLVDSLPDDFEIYEAPSDARVYVRKKKPTKIIPPERDLVHRLAEALSAYSHVQTVIEGDRIVVYTPPVDTDRCSRLLAVAIGASCDRLNDWAIRYGRFAADLRFSLIEADKRIYMAERFCYLGSIDDWITISKPAQLESLAEKTLPHLGHDSFFEIGL
jgi:hypothetical protein